MTGQRASRSVHRFLWTDRFVERFEEPSTPRIAEYLARAGAEMRVGWRAEVNLRAEDWTKSAAESLRRGFVVLIDYGHDERELYSASHSAGTLTSYKQHSQLADFLQEPGDTDITAHVDLSAVTRAAERCRPRRARAARSDLLHAWPRHHRSRGAHTSAAAGAEDVAAARRTRQHTQGSHFREGRRQAGTERLLVPCSAYVSTRSPAAALLMLSEVAHAGARRAVLDVAHAVRVDRLHPSGRRHRVQAARFVVADDQSPRVRVSCDRVDSVVGRVRRLQPADQELVLHQPSRESVRSLLRIRVGIRDDLAGEFFRRPSWSRSPERACESRSEGPTAVGRLRGSDRTSDLERRCVDAVSIARCCFCRVLPPIVWPSPYLAAPVFLGFIFLLDPINCARAGRFALARHPPWQLDERRRQPAHRRLHLRRAVGVLELLGAGKWIYTVPIFGDMKIFEMPVLGLLRLSAVRPRMLHHVCLRQAASLAWPAAAIASMMGDGPIVTGPWTIAQPRG